MHTLSPPLKPQQNLLQQVYFIPAALATGLFLFHMLFNLLDSYGIFRDEFYYLACIKRLDWGYVDQPPLSIFLLALQTKLVGDTLPALRLLPALAISGTVFITGMLVHRLGGGLFAMLLACVGVIAAPIYLAFGSYYSMNSLDIFLWAAVAYVLVLLVEAPNRNRWLLLGLLLGLGLLNKVGFLWLGAGIFTGMLLTPLRRQLLTPWPYLAAMVALLCFLPFILWNIEHDMAHLEFIRNAVAYKYAGISRLDFIEGLLLLLNPAAIILWLPGLCYLLFSQRGGNKYRILGYVFSFSFLVLLINGHSKSEYLAAAFTPLLAAGGVWLEQQRQTRAGRWFSYIALGTIITAAFLIAPMARPMLPVEPFISYAATLGIAPDNTEGKALKELPQFYADRFGWAELAGGVAKVYQGLSAAEQKQAAVYTQNYGEAGALEYYQRLYPLPPVISGHNAYWTWGWGKQEPLILIGVGGSTEDYLESYDEVSLVARHHSRYAMPYEDKLPIFLCRGLKKPMKEIWPGTKNFN